MEPLSDVELAAIPERARAEIVDLREQRDALGRRLGELYYRARAADELGELVRDGALDDAYVGDRTRAVLDWLADQARATL